MISKLFCVATAAAAVLLCTQPAFCDVDSFSQTNLSSNLSGVAPNLDPDLVNPWGIAFSATSPFWISDNGSGLSTLYNGGGVKLGLTVTIPPPTGGTPPSAPTGVVFNGTASFGGSRFIFDTEDGTISAWTSGTTAALEVDNSASGAVYKGLTMGNNGSGDLLYAANFNSGHVDVFNSSFSPVALAGSFTDPSLPAGYAPFDIQNIGGDLYVTYALQDAAKHDDVAGPGHGYVDVYDLNGNLVERLISNGALDSPWGLAVAPATFGAFAGDLLVGNFGDGQIEAYNKITGQDLGTIEDSHGNPIVIQGLWGLSFGNGGAGFSPNQLYFTAGIPGPGVVEDNGLFGEIQPTPEPSALLPIAAISFALLLRRRRQRS